MSGRSGTGRHRGEPGRCSGRAAARRGRAGAGNPSPRRSGRRHPAPGGRERLRQRRLLVGSSLARSRIRRGSTSTILSSGPSRSGKTCSSAASHGSHDSIPSKTRPSASRSNWSRPNGGLGDEPRGRARATSAVTSSSRQPKISTSLEVPHRALVGEVELGEPVDLVAQAGRSARRCRRSRGRRRRCRRGRRSRPGARPGTRAGTRRATSRSTSSSRSRLSPRRTTIGSASSTAGRGAAGATSPARRAPSSPAGGSASAVRAAAQVPHRPQAPAHRLDAGETRSKAASPTPAAARPGSASAKACEVVREPLGLASPSAWRRGRPAPTRAWRGAPRTNARAASGTATTESPRPEQLGDRRVGAEETREGAERSRQSGSVDRFMAASRPVGEDDLDRVGGLLDRHVEQLALLFAGRRSTWSVPAPRPGGLPTPMRTRAKSSECRCDWIDRSPLCPAVPPPTLTFTTPGGRSSSSCTITSRSRSSTE